MSYTAIELNRYSSANKPSNCSDNLWNEMRECRADYSNGMTLEALETKYVTNNGKRTFNWLCNVLKATGGTPYSELGNDIVINHEDRKAVNAYLYDSDTFYASVPPDEDHNTQEELEEYARMLESSPANVEVDTVTKYWNIRNEYKKGASPKKLAVKYELQPGSLRQILSAYGEKKFLGADLVQEKDCDEDYEFFNEDANKKANRRRQTQNSSKMFAKCFKELNKIKDEKYSIKEAIVTPNDSCCVKIEARNGLSEDDAEYLCKQIRDLVNK